MTPFFHLLFQPKLFKNIILYLKVVKIHFMALPFGPFWSAKYLSFAGESCEIRISSHSIQETYT